MDLHFALSSQASLQFQVVQEGEREKNELGKREREKKWIRKERERMNMCVYIGQTFWMFRVRFFFPMTQLQ